MSLSIIVAMAHDRVIGLNNQMPWHLPADLAWFKKNTLNKPVIMGRKTFESIGRPLPNRHNIIISRTPQHSDNPQITWVNSLEQALACTKDCDEAFIIGGGNIYQQALPYVNRLYITQIELDVKGDTRFPAYNPEQWQCIFTQTHQPDEKNPYQYTFQILANKASE